MAGPNVTLTLQTADRTRKAQINVPRTMYARDIIKASRSKWVLSFGTDFQIVNLTTNKQISPQDRLTADVVQDGDVLMLQPFATHGRR